MGLNDGCRPSMGQAAHHGVTIQRNCREIDALVYISHMIWSLMS
jgi:hypothetical protein